MIIKKKEFAYSKKTRQQWPFTVPEVAVVAVLIQDTKPPEFAYAIVHNWLTYALSGILETQHGLMPLEETGIWANDPDIKGTKKNLTPFFQYLTKRMNEGK